MTSINRLTQNSALIDKDIIPIWDATNKRTRAVLSSTLLEYTSAADIVGAKIENGHLILVTKEGKEIDAGELPAHAGINISDSGAPISGSFTRISFNDNLDVTASGVNVDVNASINITSGGESVKSKELIFNSSLTATTTDSKTTLGVASQHINVDSKVTESITLGNNLAGVYDADTKTTTINASGGGNATGIVESVDGLAPDDAGNVQLSALTNEGGKVNNSESIKLKMYNTGALSDGAAIKLIDIENSLTFNVISSSDDRGKIELGDNSLNTTLLSAESPTYTDPNGVSYTIHSDNYEPYLEGVEQGKVYRGTSDTEATWTAEALFSVDTSAAITTASTSANYALNITPSDFTEIVTKDIGDVLQFRADLVSSKLSNLDNNARVRQYFSIAELEVDTGDIVLAPLDGSNDAAIRAANFVVIVTAMSSLGIKSQLQYSNGTDDIVSPMTYSRLLIDNSISGRAYGVSFSKVGSIQWFISSQVDDTTSVWKKIPDNDSILNNESGDWDFKSVSAKNLLSMGIDNLGTESIYSIHNMDQSINFPYVGSISIGVKSGQSIELGFGGGVKQLFTEEELKLGGTKLTGANGIELSGTSSGGDYVDILHTDATSNRIRFFNTGTSGIQIATGSGGQVSTFIASTIVSRLTSASLTLYGLKLQQIADAVDDTDAVNLQSMVDYTAANYPSNVTFNKKSGFNSISSGGGSTCNVETSGKWYSNSAPNVNVKILQTLNDSTKTKGYFRYVNSGYVDSAVKFFDRSGNQTTAHDMPSSCPPGVVIEGYCDYALNRYYLSITNSVMDGFTSITGVYDNATTYITLSKHPVAAIKALELTLYIESYGQVQQVSVTVLKDGTGWNVHTDKKGHYFNYLDLVLNSAASTEYLVFDLIGTGTGEDISLNYKAKNEL